jgi:hypothetical protein
MTEADRRRYPRFKVNVPVQIACGSERLSGLLMDLCRDAALIESATPIAVGTEVILAAELPGTGGPVQAVGKVVRLSPGPGGNHDMAVLFTDLSPAAETRIDYFIALQTTS